jgi:cadmium resistance transport/sequestration family protein
MNELGFLTAIPTGITAFCATNLDDILILLLFFTQVNAEFRRRDVVFGQYLGFFGLILASVPGFFGGILFPDAWIGMLGIVPIFIGINRLFNGENHEDDEEPTQVSAEKKSAPNGFISQQTYSVAAITFANGGDNIGIYIPLFASSSWESLVVILGEFFVLVGVWCYAAYQLTKINAIAENLTRYGNLLVPYVLIGLGILILIDSHILENRGLAVLTLIVCVLGLLTLTHNRNPLTEVILPSSQNDQG